MTKSNYFKVIEITTIKIKTVDSRLEPAITNNNLIVCLTSTKYYSF